MKNSPPIGIAFFNTLKTLLEELFQPDWFIHAREKTHPAYARWSLCTRLIEQNGILRFPDEWGTLLTLGQLLLDSYNLVALTNGDMMH